MAEVTTPMKYVVGIDVGSRSLGLAAVEVDDAGTPINVLNAISLIHDAGLDPDSNKRALTRKNVSGVARRTRRMYRERKKRLAKLDNFLTENGFPLVDLASTPDASCWEARSALTTARITDQKEMREKLSLALRHIARHRGWRNPYSSVESLFNPSQQPSAGLLAIREEFKAHTGTYSTVDATIAELVSSLKDPKLKLRGKNGLFSERLHQKDLAMEIHKMARVQGLSHDLTEALLTKVFDSKSPKGSSADKVGRDRLDPSKFRAWRAVRAFQEYRIVAFLANVRLVDRTTSTNELRPPNIEERKLCFNFLNKYERKDPPTWSEVAELLGVDRGDLKGTASSLDDGERISSIPPVNETGRILANCTIKELKTFWKKSDEATQDALVREFSNVDAPSEDSPEAIAASTVLRTLPAESLDKLESIRLPDGRAAYSEQTLRKLTQFMLENVADVYTARKEVFGVEEDWKPTPPPIHEKTGNPAVDRVLKGVNRWLSMAQYRWGVPHRINIETLRAGFKSERLAREIERDQDQRAQRNRAMLADMETALNIQGQGRRSELIRFQALQRQNGQCAYCGTSIDFKSMELDHIVPRAGAGSTNARVNLLATCGRCNREKGNLPFAVWAKKTPIAEVSLENAIQRVSQWAMDPGLKGAAWKKFQAEVIMRLKRTSEDEEIDARSKEAVSWMAVELSRRLDGFFDKDSVQNKPIIAVFRGEVTSSARHAAGIENSFKLIGGKSGKNRLDRRHHALDAAVIALMQQTVAQVLTERNSLRSQQRLTGHVDPAFGDWREFRGRSIEAQVTFRKWQQRMKALIPLLQSAIDLDEVPVIENVRLRLGNSLAHEEKIHPLLKIPLGEALTPDLINRAASTALWTALTRHPDHSWEKGLPADVKREIQVNGTSYRADDLVEFFPVKAGALKVRSGYVELGSSFHHARLYKLTNKGRTSYAMMRVYTVDLLSHRHDDLFSVEVPLGSMSVRQSEPKLQKALREGTAEYVTWFVVGDEIELETTRLATGHVAEFLDAFEGTTRWRIRGFFSKNKLRLKPSQLSPEGLTDGVSDASKKIIDDPGWLPSVNKVFSEGGATLIRRDAHGRERFGGQGGLPHSVKV